ncbi:hypothetical protein [Oceanobacillus sp. 1P07AA]|uniref:hypothetical protein n=1 Tax=Oceanobacillus sp. 1P07AA TaxID=3132293 RepID=UPI0039A62FEC
MQIFKVEEAEQQAVNDFLERNENVSKDLLFSHGYVVEMNGRIDGCFVLKPIEDNAYWLKQLYITQSEARKLPVLLEGILVIARKIEAKCVYVHSNQPVVDILLEALQFKREEQIEVRKIEQHKKGNWWTYNVS